MPQRNHGFANSARGLERSKHLRRAPAGGGACSVHGRQQRHITARRRSVDRHRLLGAKAVQIMRPAGFRAGAAQAFAAEGLHADHRADHVAVHINVADIRGAGQRLRARIDARLDAQRQAVAER